MASPAPIKVGFVGLSENSGWAADILGPALLDASLRSKYELVAVSTTSADSAQASAKKYSDIVGHAVKAYFCDPSEIANDPDVNFVAVSVQAPHHKQGVMPAIEAGKDFFLEWPAGSSLKETEEIAEAARSHGVRSMIGLHGRHSRTIAKVKQLLETGAIGPVHSTNILAHIGREITAWPPFVNESLVYTTERKNGASRLDIPIGHQLDTLTFLLGDFTSLMALDATFFPTAIVLDDSGQPTGRTFPSETPDHFAISGVLASGVVANIFYRGGYASGPQTGRRQFVWEIDGEEGTLRMQSDHVHGALANIIIESELFLNGEKVEVDGSIDAGALDCTTSAWREFACRREGKEGSYATIDDAVKNRRLLKAIERSAAEGRRVVI